MSPAELTDVLGAAKVDLEARVGEPVRWYRPPYGEFTLQTWRVVKSLGLTPVVWSRTCWDWKEIDQATRLKVACMRRRPGTIILAHDGHATVHDGADSVREPVLDRHQLVPGSYVAMPRGECGRGRWVKCSTPVPQCSVHISRRGLRAGQPRMRSGTVRTTTSRCR